MRCEVCGYDMNETWVASVPAVPISCAYCERCLAAGAHPWWVLVGNTAMTGWDHCADWWKEMVLDTCKHLGFTLEQFLVDVKEDQKRFDEYMTQQLDELSQGSTDVGQPDS